MPPTQQKPDSRLEAIVSLLEKSPTREEFLTSFEEVVKVVLQIKKEQSQFTEEVSKALSAVLQKIQGDHTSSLDELKGQVNDLFVSEQLRKISSDLSERVDAKLATVVDGNDGHTPTKAELTALITPLIPAPKKGKDANEDAIYNRLKKDIEESIVKDLGDRLKKVESRPSSFGGGRSSNSTRFYDLSSQTNGTLKVFSVPKSVASLLHSSDFPNILMQNNGFTLNATRTELTMTTDNAPSTGSQLIYQYSQYFNT